MVFEKSDMEAKPKPEISLLWVKSIVNITTSNVKSFNTINQVPELTAFAVKHNIIICMQEHRYYHSETELKYHNSSNEWTFVLISARRNYANAAIGRVGMLLSASVLKSLHGIKRIETRIMCASFNGNLCTTTISCYPQCQWLNVHLHILQQAIFPCSIHSQTQ